jgi:hypothetical protein
VDAERDKLFDDLKRTGDLEEFIVVPGFHSVREGRNGEGNPWYTDGNLYEGAIKAGSPNSDSVLIGFVARATTDLSGE